MPKKDKDMWTSVSAITDADDCMRRWWFTKEVKLPKEQRKATIFGDVGHAVAERFLRANDRGLGPDNNPVEIYPTGWMTMKNRFDKTNTLYTVSDSEAALIKVLINKAITEGILIREPGRVIEKEIETLIYQQGFAKVVLRGFMDLTTPRGITDHKFIKNKKYALSKNKLKQSIQMVGYAKERYLCGHQGNIWLTHNNFIKDFDAPSVIQRSVEVTQFEVEEFFNQTILPLVRKMLDYHLRYPKAMIHKWRDLPGANSPNQSCNHHYGKACPFIGICTGMCSIDNYLMKYGITINELVGNVEIIEKGSSKMGSLIDKIKAEQNKAGGGTAATVPVTTAQATGAVEVKEEAAQTAPVVATGLTALIAQAKVDQGIAAPVAAEQTTVAPVVAEAASAVAEKQKAPWYQEYNGEPCVACKENPVLGFNSKMEICAICDIRAREAGVPTSIDYRVDVLDGGALQFTLISGTQEPSTTIVAEAPEAKTEIIPSGPETVKALSTALEAIKSIPGNIEEGKPDVLLSGLTLLIGCTFAKNNSFNNCVYADELVKGALDYIEQTAGKEAGTIEHFALMQAIDAYVPSLAEAIQNTTVISTLPSKGSAHARLIDGLRMLATNVIYPFAV